MIEPAARFAVDLQGAGFELTFKGDAALVNGKTRFLSEITNRAGTRTKVPGMVKSAF